MINFKQIYDSYRLNRDVSYEKSRKNKKNLVNHYFHCEATYFYDDLIDPIIKEIRDFFNDDKCYPHEFCPECGLTIDLTGVYLTQVFLYRIFHTISEEFGYKIVKRLRFIADNNPRLLTMIRNIVDSIVETKVTN